MIVGPGSLILEHLEVKAVTKIRIWPSKEMSVTLNELSPSFTIGLPELQCISKPVRGFSADKLGIANG